MATGEYPGPDRGIGGLEHVDWHPCAGGEQREKGPSHQRQAKGNRLEGPPAGLHERRYGTLRHDGEERCARQEDASTGVIAGQAPDFEGEAEIELVVERQVPHHPHGKAHERAVGQHLPPGGGVGL